MSAAAGSLAPLSLSESPLSGSSAESKRSKDKESAKLPFPCPEFSEFQEKFLKSPKEAVMATNSEGTKLIDTLCKNAPHWIFDARHFMEVLILIPERHVYYLTKEWFVEKYLNENIDDALNKLKKMFEIIDKESLMQYGKILMLDLIDVLSSFQKDFPKIEKIFSFIEYLIYEKNISPNFYLNDRAPFYNLIYRIGQIRSLEPEHHSIMKKMVSKLIKALIKFNFDFNSLPQGKVKFGGNDNDSPLHFVLRGLDTSPLLINILTKILSLQANPLLISCRNLISPKHIDCALSLLKNELSARRFPSPLPLLYQYGTGLMHREKRRELTKRGINKTCAKLEHEIFFPFAKPDDSASFDDVTDSKEFAERLSTTRLEFEEIDRLSVVCQNVLQADPKVLAEGVLAAVERNKDAIINCRSNLNSALFECFGIRGLTNITLGYLSDALIPTQRVKIK